MKKYKKKIVIITSYITGEGYGLLGPQMAATYIRNCTDYDCIVVGVSRTDSKDLLKKHLIDFFDKEKPIVAFSTLSGREDLFQWARELTNDGFVTFLAGPQANVDYLGEIDWQKYPHRFRGLSDYFSFALQGPVEQLFQLLPVLKDKNWSQIPGILYKTSKGQIQYNKSSGWNEKFLSYVDWNTLFTINESGFMPIPILSAQVVQEIGCAYAQKQKMVEIDYPSNFTKEYENKIKIPTHGCSFCDVAIDKGFSNHHISSETVLHQITCLPENDEKRKIPFELINENPLPKLPKLLHEIKKRDIHLSCINLTLRADWLIKNERHLRDALVIARSIDCSIIAQSVGFESFDSSILQNLHKGITLTDTIRAITLMRNLKRDFFKEWGYAKRDGAIHGFIHPTPWDTPQTMRNMKTTIERYGLYIDILPDYSIPLIIHHASALADWIRKIEIMEGIQYKRNVSIIEWWESSMS